SLVFVYYVTPVSLLSFPTRRSSDLQVCGHMNAGIPKGTRDFGPEELYKRRYIFTTIQKYFELYGYSPIETPAMENLDTLLGKYGDRKSTRLNSSHVKISYAVFCLKK